MADIFQLDRIKKEKNNINPDCLGGVMSAEMTFIHIADENGIRKSPCQ